MSQDLAALGRWFAADDWPDAVCPACMTGNLRADPANEVETTASQNARTHEAWEPEWIGGYFSCVLRCQRAKCGETVIAVGEWKIEERGLNNWEEWDNRYYTSYRLRTTVPPIPITKKIANLPSSVQESLSKASRVIWSDPGAAGNRLRLAVELALDELGIERRTAGPKPIRLSAHRRIEILRATSPEAAEYLEAVKWVGNQATHEDSVTISDVLESAQFLEAAFTLLFDTTPAESKRRAQEINKHRGVPIRDERHD